MLGVTCRITITLDGSDGISLDDMFDKALATVGGVCLGAFPIKIYGLSDSIQEVDETSDNCK